MIKEMGPIIALLLISLGSIDCVNREKLGSTPQPQKKFSVEKWLGDWYFQARLSPCSWAGSADFTNFVSQYRKQPSGTVHSMETWRSGECVTITTDLQPQNTSGVFINKDPIGDVISGDVVVVAADYKAFVVSWGCSKRAVDGRCSDPRVSVKTRKRNPSPRTWHTIEAILDHYWSLGLYEMVRVIHDENACVQFILPKQLYGPPMGYKYLWKKY